MVSKGRKSERNNYNVTFSSLNSSLFYSIIENIEHEKANLKLFCHF